MTSVAYYPLRTLFPKSSLIDSLGCHEFRTSFSPRWGVAATRLPETVKRENERDKQRGRAGKAVHGATWHMAVGKVLLCEDHNV